MTDFRAKAIHSIPGNALLFDKNNRELRLDERWRAQLTDPDTAIFSRIAGRHNRRYGYH